MTIVADFECGRPIQIAFIFTLWRRNGRSFCMEPKQAGYHHATVGGIYTGARYFYRLSTGKEFPDPVSRYQPEGVHGPSEVVDPAFRMDRRALVRASDRRLRHLRIARRNVYAGRDLRRRHSLISIDLADLGITAIELMPVAQFPGARNWGYDGVYPFAVQNSYRRTLRIEEARQRMS